MAAVGFVMAPEEVRRHLDDTWFAWIGGSGADSVQGPSRVAARATRGKLEKGSSYPFLPKCDVRFEHPPVAALSRARSATVLPSATLPRHRHLDQGLAEDA